MFTCTDEMMEPNVSATLTILKAALSSFRPLGGRNSESQSVDVELPRGYIGTHWRCFSFHVSSVIPVFIGFYPF